MPVPELETFRAKYPDYGDMSDTDLANRLAQKYPDAYGDLPGKVQAAPVAADMTKNAAPSSIGSAVSAVTDNPLVQGAATMVKKSAMPIAGQMAGAALGTTVGGPVGSVVGEAIGGGVGEAANQLAGITEPSLAEIFLATIGGPITRGVLGVVRKGAGAAINAFGGRQAISDIASDVMTKMMGPKTPSDELFQTVSKLNGFVPTFRTGKAIQNALSSEAGKPSAVSQSIREALAPYQGYFATQGSGAAATTAHSVADIATNAQDLRLAASLAYKAGNTRLGTTLNDVRGALLDDATASGVPELSAAANAVRREMSVDKLGEILRKANPLKEFNDALSGKAKDRLFATQWSQSEQDQIKNVIGKLTQIAPSGFSGVAGRSIAGALASSVPSDPMVKGAAAIAGFMAPDLMAKAITTKAGRSMVEKMLTNENITNPQTWTAISQFVRSQYAEDAKSGPLKDAFDQIMKSKGVPIDDKIKAALNTMPSVSEIYRGKGRTQGWYNKNE